LRTPSLRNNASNSKFDSERSLLKQYRLEPPLKKSENLVRYKAITNGQMTTYIAEFYYGDKY